MVKEQLRIYIPGVAQGGLNSLLHDLTLRASDVRPAFAVPVSSGSAQQLVDVWHVEFYGGFSSGKSCAPPEFPREYDEIAQTSRGTRIVTTTYLRSDVPDYSRVRDAFERDADEAHQRNIQIYKGQHPDLSTVQSRCDGMIAIASPQALTAIVNALTKVGIVAGFCVTQETVL